MLYNQGQMQRQYPQGQLPTQYMPGQFQTYQEPGKKFKKRSGAGTFFLGQQEKFNQTPTVTPGQAGGIDALLNMGLYNQNNPYEGYQPLEEEAIRQFKTETIPGLAENFAGADALNSSGFQGALGSAGAGLQSMLAAQKAKYGQNQQEFGLRQADQGLRSQFDTNYTKPTSGFLKKFVSELLSGDTIKDFVKAYLGGGSFLPGQNK